MATFLSMTRRQPDAYALKSFADVVNALMPVTLIKKLGILKRANMVQTLTLGEASGPSQQDKQQIPVGYTLNISNHMEVRAQESPNADEGVDTAPNVQETGNPNRSTNVNAVVHAAVTNEKMLVTRCRG
ncbi:hypothetical protein ACH5RR_032407 [Cinchona calisaya]|uniref:Uncharacterized protein n=1 Tax=Cinchona calisaya TaxID=153742 RepID=A0ABD2YM82_9GENT